MVRDADLDAGWLLIGWLPGDLWELDLATDVVGVHAGPRLLLVRGPALASLHHVLDMDGNSNKVFMTRSRSTRLAKGTQQ